MEPIKLIAYATPFAYGANGLETYPLQELTQSEEMVSDYDADAKTIGEIVCNAMLLGCAFSGQPVAFVAVQLAPEGE